MIFTIHSITHSLWLKTASQLHLTLQNAIDCALIRSRGMDDGGKDAKLHNETTGWPMVLCQILSSRPCACQIRAGFKHDDHEGRHYYTREPCKKRCIIVATLVVVVSTNQPPPHPNPTVPGVPLTMPPLAGPSLRGRCAQVAQAGIAPGQNRHRRRYD